jgi:heat shock protein HslJ
MRQAPVTALLLLVAALWAAPLAAQNRGGPPERVGDKLENTRWQAESIDGSPVADPSAMTIDFLPGGEQVRGQAGCNRFVGPFASRADKVTLGILRQSREECAPALAAAQKQLIEMLHDAYRAELADGVLTLYSRRGDQIRFVRRSG